MLQALQAAAVLRNGESVPKPVQQAAKQLLQRRKNRSVLKHLKPGLVRKAEDKIHQAVLQAIADKMPEAGITVEVQTSQCAIM